MNNMNVDVARNESQIIHLDMANDDATESATDSQSITYGDDFTTLYGLFPLVDRMYEKAKLVLRFSCTADPEHESQTLKLLPQTVQFISAVLQEPLLNSFSRYKQRQKQLHGYRDKIKEISSLNDTLRTSQLAHLQIVNEPEKVREADANDVVELL